MKFDFKHILFFTLIFAASNIQAQQVTLKSGTTIPVRLTQNINGNINNQGETIFFEVMENISVESHIVIEKGTFVKGKITNAESRKSLGKAGKLSLEARSLNAVDGQLIELVREPMSSEGRKRTGATVAHVIMWGPIGLFAKGRAARIMLDTEFDIEVRSDIEINTTEKNIESNAVESDNIEVYFSKYSGKINFAKGKIGKDFKLHIQLPETTSLNRKDIKIVRALEYKLPKSIFPSSISWNSKANNFIAIFPFKEVVKYIAPGITNITVEVVVGNKNHVGEAAVQTKWKMK